MRDLEEITEVTIPHDFAELISDLRDTDSFSSSFVKIVASKSFKSA